MDCRRENCGHRGEESGQFQFDGQGGGEGLARRSLCSFTFAKCSALVVAPTPVNEPTYPIGDNAVVGKKRPVNEPTYWRQRR